MCTQTPRALKVIKAHLSLHEVPRFYLATAASLGFLAGALLGEKMRSRGGRKGGVQSDSVLMQLWGTLLSTVSCAHRPLGTALLCAPSLSSKENPRRVANTRSLPLRPDLEVRISDPVGASGLGVATLCRQPYRGRACGSPCARPRRASRALITAHLAHFLNSYLRHRARR